MVVNLRPLELNSGAGLIAPRHRSFRGYAASSNPPTALATVSSWLLRPCPPETSCAMEIYCIEAPCGSPVAMRTSISVPLLHALEADTR